MGRSDAKRADYAMKIEYTPAVELALAKANTMAHRSGASEVRPVDLLHGLVDEEEGHPVVRALAAGANLEGLRRLFPACETSGEPPTPLPLAPTTADILAHAHELTRLHGAEQSVSSDQLILAALEIDPAARSLLESIGLDFTALKESINPTAPPVRLETPLDLAPPTETIDTARIVDASANRAREALRVLEDYARFVRGDAFLSAQIKTLRHRLAEALRQLPGQLLLQSRDTLHDVGTTITTDQEQERDSPSAVAQANSKRLQEAPQPGRIRQGPRSRLQARPSSNCGIPNVYPRTSVAWWQRSRCPLGGCQALCVGDRKLVPNFAGRRRA